MESASRNLKNDVPKVQASALSEIMVLLRDIREQVGSNSSRTGEVVNRAFGPCAEKEQANKPQEVPNGIVAEIRNIMGQISEHANYQTRFIEQLERLV
jgi:hypothetical protein